MKDSDLAVILRQIANALEIREKMIRYKSCLVCEKRFNCEYDVGYDEPVRINCPHYERRE